MGTENAGLGSPVTPPYSFTVAGAPKVKERPRVLKSGKTYTPKATAIYEAAIAAAYDGPSFEGPVRLDVCFEQDRTVVRIIPMDASEKPKLRGDIDNYLKALQDGLVKGGAFDDNQIVLVRVRKK